MLLWFLLQMAAFNIQEALIWKEKIEYVIDQVCFIELHNPIMFFKYGLISIFLNFLLDFISPDSPWFILAWNMKSIYLIHG